MKFQKLNKKSEKLNWKKQSSVYFSSDGLYGKNVDLILLKKLKD